VLSCDCVRADTARSGCQSLGPDERVACLPGARLPADRHHGDAGSGGSQAAIPGQRLVPGGRARHAQRVQAPHRPRRSPQARLSGGFWCRSAQSRDSDLRLPISTVTCAVRLSSHRRSCSRTEYKSFVALANACALSMSTSCRTRLLPEHHKGEPAAEPDKDFGRRSARVQTLADAPLRTAELTARDAASFSQMMRRALRFADGFAGPSVWRFWTNLRNGTCFRQAEARHSSMPQAPVGASHHA